MSRNQSHERLQEQPHEQPHEQPAYFSAEVHRGWVASRAEAAATLKELRAAGWWWAALARRWRIAPKTVQRWAAGISAPRIPYLRQLRQTLREVRAGRLAPPSRGGGPKSVAPVAESESESASESVPPVLESAESAA